MRAIIFYLQAAYIAYSLSLQDVMSRCSTSAQFSLRGILRLALKQKNKKKKKKKN